MSARIRDRTMCCVQVVPLLGYEQTKTSDGRRARDLHFLIVAQEVMGSRGMGGNDVSMVNLTLAYRNFLASSLGREGCMVSTICKLGIVPTEVEGIL